MKRTLSLVSVLVLLFLTLPLLTNTRVWAACSFSTIGAQGNLTISTCTYAMQASCAVNTNTVEQYTCASTEGGSTNAYVISVGSSTLTVTAGSTTELITGVLSPSSTGSVAIGAGAKVTLSNGTNSVLWVADGDNDGFSADFTTTYTATAAGRRLRNLMRSTTADCNDAAHSTTNTCYPAFYPAFYPVFAPYGGFSPYGGFYPQFSP